MPTPQALFEDPKTPWIRRTLRWYDHHEREVEIFSATAVWYHSGLPTVPLRYVLIRDVAGRFAPQALLCTDLALPPEHILAFFMRRWQMEPTFQHVRTHLGVEIPTPVV